MINLIQDNLFINLKFPYKVLDLLFPTRINNLKYRFSLINISPVLKDHPLFLMYKIQNYLEDSSDSSYAHIYASIVTHENVT